MNYIDILYISAIAIAIVIVTVLLYAKIYLDDKHPLNRFCPLCLPGLILAFIKKIFTGWFFE